MTRIFLYGLLISLISTAAFCDCLPGEEIQVNAAVSYDNQSDSQQIVSNTAVTFVVPDDSAPTYFTIGRSFYYGASLAGKKVKMAGRISVLNDVYSIADGSISVPLRTDLLISQPSVDGTLVTVFGVCRIEDNGQLSLLLLDDTAITPAL